MSDIDYQLGFNFLVVLAATSRDAAAVFGRLRPFDAIVMPLTLIEAT